jgi:hypothetical protein
MSRSGAIRGDDPAHNFGAFYFQRRFNSFYVFDNTVGDHMQSPIAHMKAMTILGIATQLLSILIAHAAAKRNMDSAITLTPKKSNRDVLKKASFHDNRPFIRVFLSFYAFKLYLHEILTIPPGFAFLLHSLFHSGCIS